MTERQIQIAVARADLFATSILRVIFTVGILTVAQLMMLFIAFPFGEGGRAERGRMRSPPQRLRLYEAVRHRKEQITMTWDKILKAVAAAAGAIAGLFGEWNTMLTILVAMMAADYISGWIVAWCGKSPKTEGGGLSSKVGFVGLAKKGFIMLLVLVATLLDRAIGTGSSVFQSSLVLYYIANEGLSILENAALLGVKFPAKLRKALEALKEKEEDPPDSTPQE